ncbi:MAG: copper resistance protein CopD [Tardiphaga sp.]|uniref:copper homeostasis membrane protein CopD n=1 Tax=Tardiphaga sp. TaxID=1926292 RepID=UPI002606FB4D|nr:copper homeostasis membrane protein CopD [Tardiphaga sp.]MDB5505239.1 copper resistance protein CopD [Tardiphaga sp.]
MITPYMALAIDRLCFDASAIAVYGRSGFITWAASESLGRLLAASSCRWAGTACLLALIAALAWLPLEAATSGGDWHVAVDGNTLWSLMVDTAVGKAWQVRAGLALVLLAVLWWHPAGRWPFLISALLLATLALGGHARIDSGLRGVLHGLNDLVHLLSGGAWLGALLMLPFCLARLRDPVLGADARAALRRFSYAGHFAVGLVIATGIVNAVLILPRGPIELGSTYQLLLAVKIGLVATMTGLALVNRYVLVPGIRAQPGRTIFQIQIGTVAELTLGLGVLALVAAFGILDPT